MWKFIYLAQNEMPSLYSSSKKHDQWEWQGRGFVLKKGGTEISWCSAQATQSWNTNFETIPLTKTCIQNISNIQIHLMCNFDKLLFNIWKDNDFEDSIHTSVFFGWYIGYFTIVFGIVSPSFIISSTECINVWCRIVVL